MNIGPPSPALLMAPVPLFWGRVSPIVTTNLFISDASFLGHAGHNTPKLVHAHRIGVVDKRRGAQWHEPVEDGVSHDFFEIVELANVERICAGRGLEDCERANLWCCRRNLPRNGRMGFRKMRI